MVRIFGMYVRTSTVLVAVLEGCLIAFTALSLYHASRHVPQLLLLGIDFHLGSYTGLQIMLSTGVMWVLMYAFGVYERESWYDTRTLIKRLSAAIALGSVAIFLGQYIWFAKGVSGDFAAGLGLLCFVNILLARMVVRASVPAETRYNSILVIGAGERAREIHDAVASLPAGNVLIHGLWQVHDSEPLSLPRELLIRVRGALVDYVRGQGIDEVVVALDDRRGRLPVTELLECRLDGVRVTDAATFLERETRKVDLDNVYPSWLIFGEGFSATRSMGLAKRIFDVAVSALVLFAVWPLLLATAMAVKLDSAGPVIYRQRRTGLNGKPFDVLKFRSMRVDAEADGRAVWAAANDGRVTRVGAFIRKTRIDELPQLFCVLKGDMSFVGPRPERPEFVNQLAAQIPYYNERHRVKPGITGWAQVNYPYGASIEDAREKLKYDLFYMKHHGLILDLMILVQTIRVVFWGEGAR